MGIGRRRGLAPYDRLEEQGNIMLVSDGGRPLPPGHHAVPTQPLG